MSGWDRAREAHALAGFHRMEQNPHTARFRTKPCQEMIWKGNHLFRLQRHEVRTLTDARVQEIENRGMQIMMARSAARTARSLPPLPIVVVAHVGQGEQGEQSEQGERDEEGRGKWSGRTAQSEWSEQAECSGRPKSWPEHSKRQENERPTRPERPERPDSPTATQARRALH